MRNFLQLVSDRTLFLSKKLNAFALQSLKSRILNYLRMHGTILNQQEVAQILGVARPSLARALSELASEGCIRMEEKEMRINAVSAQKVFIKNVRTYILFLPLSKNKKLWKRFYWMKSTNSCCSKSLY